MSGKFQKNLRDYVPVKSVSRKTGKEQVRYVYRGETYTFQMTPGKYRQLKIVLPISCTLQFALYLFIMLRHIPSNSSFVMLPAACSLFAMGYMDMGIFTLLTAGMEMPAWEHRSLHSRLSRGSFLSFCFFFATFLCELAFVIFFSREYRWAECFNCICYLLLALISWAVYTVWRKISFTIKQGDEKNRKEKELIDDIEHAFGKTSDFH